MALVSSSSLPVLLRCSQFFVFRNWMLKENALPLNILSGNDWLRRFGRGLYGQAVRFMALDNTDTKCLDLVAFLQEALIIRNELLATRLKW